MCFEIQGRAQESNEAVFTIIASHHVPKIFRADLIHVCIYPIGRPAQRAWLQCTGPKSGQLQDRNLVNFKTEIWSTSRPKSGQLQEGPIVWLIFSYVRHDLGTVLDYHVRAHGRDKYLGT
jgi:hypothetical protein